jgi:hypothetical protein
MSRKPEQRRWEVELMSHVSYMVNVAAATEVEAESAAREKWRESKDPMRDFAGEIERLAIVGTSEGELA